ncbi:MAG: dTDP-4-dehydrorhamnose reductase [Fimbriimonadales bacterium]
MKVLVVGATGLLGQDIVRVANERGWELSTPSHEAADVTDPSRLVEVIGTAAPRWVINCAAYVAVDDAEDEPDAAFALNDIGAGNVVTACERAGCRLIHISTDYVFGGEKKTPYSETDETRPLGVYAASKLAGEIRVLAASRAAIVVRTAWLYGAARDNFPLKILRAALSGKDLRLVSDRIGSPTYTRDLAFALAEIVEKDIPSGIYHVVNEGEASWYDLCKEVLAAAGVAVDVQPAQNADYPTAAERPIYSALSTAKLESAGVSPLPHWRDAARRFVIELREKGVIPS